jgi:hypothetical protein
MIIGCGTRLTQTLQQNQICCLGQHAGEHDTGIITDTLDRGAFCRGMAKSDRTTDTQCEKVERSNHERRWFRQDEAADLVDESSLAQIIEAWR